MWKFSVHGPRCETCSSRRCLAGRRRRRGGRRPGPGAAARFAGCATRQRERERSVPWTRPSARRPERDVARRRRASRPGRGRRRTAPSAACRAGARARSPLRGRPRTAPVSWARTAKFEITSGPRSVLPPRRSRPSSRSSTCGRAEGVDRRGVVEEGEPLQRAVPEELLVRARVRRGGSLDQGRVAERGRGRSSARRAAGRSRARSERRGGRTRPPRARPRTRRRSSRRRRARRARA